MATTLTPNPFAPAATNPNQTPGLISSVQPVQAAPTPNPVPGVVPNADGTTFNAMPAPPKQEVVGYQPTARQIDPAKETVAGQFNTLTASDNPLIQMGRTRGVQQANQRGLINSTMAIGAADTAAYQAALPIAQTDAATYTQQARDNQAYSNEALKFTAGAANEAAGRDLTAWTDMAKANMDSAMKTQLATIEADYKTVMQSSATAAEMYKQAMKNITDIAANKDMDAAAKTLATQNQFYALKSGMELAGAMANLDLGSLLNFGSAPSGGLTGAAAVSAPVPAPVPAVSAPPSTYTAPNGSVWSSKAAYDAAAGAVPYNIANVGGG